MVVSIRNQGSMGPRDESAFLAQCPNNPKATADIGSVKYSSTMHLLP